MFASKQVTQSIKQQCENAKQRYKHIIEMINQQNHIDTAIKLAKIFQVYKKD